jgi:hypothetical protein
MTQESRQSKIISIFSRLVDKSEPADRLGIVPADQLGLGPSPDPEREVSHPVHTASPGGATSAGLDS